MKRSFSVWGKGIVPYIPQEHAVKQPLNKGLNIYNSQKVESGLVLFGFGFFLVLVLFGCLFWFFF